MSNRWNSKASGAGPECLASPRRFCCSWVVAVANRPRCCFCVRHPELKLNTPARVLCMSWCADRGSVAERGEQAAAVR